VTYEYDDDFIFYLPENFSGMLFVFLDAASVDAKFKKTINHKLRLFFIVF